MNIIHEVNHSFEVAAPRQPVWSFLWDPQSLARCVEGCEEVIVREEGKSYKVRVRRKVAVFAVRFELDINVLERQPESFVRLEISGQDTRLKSAVHVALRVSVEDVASNQCRINLHAAINLSGMLAVMKKTLVCMQISQTLDDFATRLRTGIEQQASCPAIAPAAESARRISS